MTNLKALGGVARVPFLLLPVTLIASGAAAAAFDGHLKWVRTVVALVGLVSLHAAVNVLNEWSDMRTGIDLQTKRTPFSGGSGTLPAGLLSTKEAFAFGVICAAIGLACGVYFVATVGLVLLPIIILGAICVVGYTDFLARVGLGEIAAGLGLGALPVVGTALVQDGTLGATALWVAFPAGYMTFNLLLLNEFPDEAADRIGGRRNLVTLCGRRTAAALYVGAGLLTPATIAAAVVVGAFPVATLLAMVPSLLLVRPVRWALSDSSQDVPIQALGANVAWNLTTNLALAATLGLSSLL
jgi:1,4-dihydroxy-2-naphthoate octaprenyltransferase